MEIDKDVFVQQGILDCQIDQLINFSNSDPEIKKFTSDQIRFHDLTSFKKWLEQGRIIYTLTDQKHNLLGIIWFGQKEPPLKCSANFTFALRIYSQARGKGLSQNFMKLSFQDLLKNQKKHQISGFWLATAKNNYAAIHVYEKFGFKSIGQHHHENIMYLAGLGK